MKKYLIIILVVGIVAILSLLFVFLPTIIGKFKQGEPQGEGPPEFGGKESPCIVAQGEWMPQKGECPSKNAELDAKCSEFCEKHPDCCGDRTEGERPFGGQERLLSLPSDGEILKLKRVYPETIKALNEGPNIYPREAGALEVMGDEWLEQVKAAGFNTIQVLLIRKKENGKLIFNDFNNSVLLNDIVAIKKHGMAVWVAMDLAGGQPGNETTIGNYDDFKLSFLDFVNKSAELMEKYKVEYFTAANEPDKPFKEQKDWSSAEVNGNLIDFFPASNAAAREKFSGKIISKITKTQNHTKQVLEASFKNIDIAGVDVGPPMDGKMSFAVYQEAFDEYQFFASLAEQAGLPWMSAEYWQSVFGVDIGFKFSNFVKENELKYAKVSFDAYLKAAPKGAGYVWNDWALFSLPQGEKTKKALSDFFGKF